MPEADEDSLPIDLPEQNSAEAGIRGGRTSRRARGGGDIFLSRLRWHTEEDLPLDPLENAVETDQELPLPGDEWAGEAGPAVDIPVVTPEISRPSIRMQPMSIGGWSSPTVPTIPKAETSLGWKSVSAQARSAPIVAPVSTAPSLTIAGEHRVVLHMLEGQVKRGTMTDIDLGAEEMTLVLAGGVTERIQFARAKALFFLLQPGEPPPEGLGKRVR